MCLLHILFFGWHLWCVVELQRACLITPRSPTTCFCVQLGTFLKCLLGSSWYFSSFYFLCGQRPPCIGGCKRTTLESHNSEKVLWSLQNNADLVFYFCCVCLSSCGLCWYISCTRTIGSLQQTISLGCWHLLCQGECIEMHFPICFQILDVPGIHSSVKQSHITRHQKHMGNLRVEK